MDPGSLLLHKPLPGEGSHGDQTLRGEVLLMFSSQSNTDHLFEGKE